MCATPIAGSTHGACPPAGRIAPVVGLYHRWQRTGTTASMPDMTVRQQRLSAPTRRPPLCPFRDRHRASLSVAGGVMMPDSQAIKSSNSFPQMKLNLFDLLQASMSDPDSPNILLTVHLSDLHQLVVDTIEATRERILPLYMDAEKERPLTRKEVAEQLGVCETTVFNMARAGKLRSFKVNGSTRYSQRDVRAIIESRNAD